MTDVLGFHHHTWAELDRLNPKDPLNFFFGGALADIERASTAIRDVLRWRDRPVVDGEQWFVEVASSTHRASWHRHDRSYASRAFTFPGFPRYHLRLYAGHLDDPEFGPLIAAPMHHEHASACLAWDAADSFIEPAERAARHFRDAGYDVVRRETGLAFTAVQCNGFPVRWDGVCYVVRA